MVYKNYSRIYWGWGEGGKVTKMIPEYNALPGNYAWNTWCTKIISEYIGG